MSSWQHNPSSFLMKAYRLSQIEQARQHTGCIFTSSSFILIMQLWGHQWGDFCPTVIFTVIFEDAVGERGRAGREIVGVGVMHQTEEEQRGMHAVMLCPWTLTPLTVVPSVFSPLVDGTSSFFSPLFSLRWKCHHPPHIMRPCPV